MDGTRKSVYCFSLWVTILFPSAFGFCGGVSAASQSLDLPRLVVVIVVDGFPEKQLTQYFDQLGGGGLRLLVGQGAWFSNAHYGHSTTVTAAGHATIMTGARPYRHGIIGNQWMDRDRKAQVYCVQDPSHSYLGQSSIDSAGTSPRNLKVTTFGDELRLASRFSRVVAVSGKDRAAILSAGRLGEAYFYSSKTGRFLTTTYYREDYPDWWQEFYSTSPQDRWFSKQWEPLLEEQAYARSAPDDRSHHLAEMGLGKRFPHPVNGGRNRLTPAYYAALMRVPFGDEYTVEFVKAAIEGERLGKNPHGVADILVLGLSTHDYVNHLFGPESKQSHDHVLRLDRSLAELFDFLQEWVGLDDTAIVFTSDHGFAYTPEYCTEIGLEAGRIDPYQMIDRLNEFLSSEFEPGQYVIAWFLPTVYLDYQVIENKNLDPVRVERAAARFLTDQPGIEAVFTRTQLQSGHFPPTRLARQVMHSWDPQQSGDLFVIQKSCWYLMARPNALAAPHGSPHAYDTHVPLIFLGRWFRAGKYGNRVEIVDVATTLSHLLNVGSPSGSEGKVLVEILK